MKDRETKWFMSYGKRQILEEVKAVRSGLRSVACLSPGAMVISGLEPLPGAMSASVVLMQRGLCRYLWLLLPLKTESIWLYRVGPTPKWLRHQG